MSDNTKVSDFKIGGIVPDEVKDKWIKALRSGKYQQGM